MAKLGCTDPGRHHWALLDRYRETIELYRDCFEINHRAVRGNSPSEQIRSGAYFRKRPSQGSFSDLNAEGIFSEI